LRAIHDDLERLHERCSDQLVTPGEIAAQLKDLDHRFFKALPVSTDLYRYYDRSIREATDWWHETVSGYVDPQDCRNIGRRIAIAREILARINPEFLQAAAAPQGEYYFPPGDVFRAKQRVYQTMAQASASVLVVDGYLDPVALDFVEALPPQVSVQLLTGAQPKGLFVQQLRVLEANRGKLEARSSAASHDRWILLDGSDLWHLGCSLNGLGKAAARMSRVSAEPHRAVTIADIGSWWSAGTRI
jgi:hypothetical protein